VVPLQFLSLNLTSPTHLAEVNETVLTVSVNTNENVTKPTFRFDFGDGTVTQESFLNTAYHMYHFTGNYTMRVQARSLCNTSMLIETASISVPKPVRFLKNITLHSEATVFGEETQFHLLVGQGSDFACLWLLGDQVNHTTSRSDPGTIILNHVYLSPSAYTARATCQNRRSELSVTDTVQVQKVIVGLKIFPVCPILFGTQFLVRWQIDDGTGVIYKANFSRITLEVKKSDDELHGQAWVTKHDYKTPGEFFFHVSASNAVTKWDSVTVKCIILRKVSPFTPIVFHRARDIEINETVSIWFTDVNSASEINASYFVSFGDNSKVMITRETRVTHSYDYYGLYTVKITADNQVSTFNASITIKVHKPVVKLKAFTIPSLVARVNENVDIIMFLHSGSDIVCRWEFGDGQELVQNPQHELIYFKGLELSVMNFTNVSISVRHIFNEVGVYKISATCQNRLSEVKATAYATVQKEITLFQVLPIDPVVFGKMFFLNFTVATGTNVTFTAFLNQQRLQTERHRLYHLSKVTLDIYKQAGQYNLTITATNLVTPSLRHTQIVVIEVPVSEVHINVSYLEAHKMHAGHGANMNIFPEGVPVVFQATADNGSSLQYTWSICDTKDLSSNNIRQHTFHRAGTYKVSVHVENHVSRAASSVVTAVQKRTSFLHGGLVKCSSPKVVNKIVTIQVTIEILGTNATLVIGMDNTTSYWYGDIANYQEWKRNNTNATVQYQGELKGKNTILNHVYKTPAIYTIKASLGNALSRSSSTCEVEILPRPCKKPNVKLKSIGGTPDDAGRFFRADTINIQADVDVFCPESKMSKYEWKIFQSNPNTGSFEQFHDDFANGEASMQELQLKRRTLPVGLFRLRLTVGMVEEELKDFLTIAEGYIRVLQSPLIATISGGSEIRRGFGSTISVDGGRSYDPDIGPGNNTGKPIGSLISAVKQFFQTCHLNCSPNDDQPLG